MFNAVQLIDAEHPPKPVTVNEISGSNSGLVKQSQTAGAEAGVHELVRSVGKSRFKAILAPLTAACMVRVERASWA